jgi:hypothetical protein
VRDDVRPNERNNRISSHISVFLSQFRVARVYRSHVVLMRFGAAKLIILISVLRLLKELASVVSPSSSVSSSRLRTLPHGHLIGLQQWDDVRS